MRKNMLKEKIRNGESAIGTFVKLTDPAVPELLALAGFDFFVLDTEHVAVDREPVSYTHLDVYKRQLFPFRFLNFLVSLFVSKRRICELQI